jgi:hypothetical protein
MPLLVLTPLAGGWRACVRQTCRHSFVFIHRNNAILQAVNCWRCCAQEISDRHQILEVLVTRAATWDNGYAVVGLFPLYDLREIDFIDRRYGAPFMSCVLPNLVIRQPQSRPVTQMHDIYPASHLVDIEITAPNLDAACFNHPPIPSGTVASDAAA